MSITSAGSSPTPTSSRFSSPSSWSCTPRHRSTTKRLARCRTPSRPPSSSSVSSRSPPRVRPSTTPEVLPPPPPSATATLTRPLQISYPNSNRRSTKNSPATPSPWNPLPRASSSACAKSECSPLPPPNSNPQESLDRDSRRTCSHRDHRQQRWLVSSCHLRPHYGHIVRPRIRHQQKTLIP